MPLVLRLSKKGEHHPTKSLWGRYITFNNGEEVRKQGERELQKWRLCKSIADLEARGYRFSSANHILTHDAWIIYWADEPEENEFGIITP